MSKVRQVLLVLLGLMIGMLLGLLVLVYVLAHRSSGEIYWPVVRVFARFGWIAVWSCALLAFWLVWRSGLSTVFVSSPPPAMQGSVATSLRALGIGFLVTLTVGGGSLALVPGRQNDNMGGMRLLPVLPPPSAPAPLISYVVFFPNGSPDILKSDLVALRHFLHELSQCHGLTIRLTAFVSSAPYPDNDEERELDLIQRRLNAVSLLAASEGLNKVLSEQSFKEMQVKRGFIDQVEAKRLITREPFNRRVEITVSSYGDCGAPISQAAPLPGKAAPAGKDVRRTQ